MQALFIGQTYIDVTFITDHMPTGDEKHVASAYAVSFGGNAVTAAFCLLATILYALAPRLLVFLAFGREFEDAADLLWMFALAMTGYALLNVLLAYHLGRGSGRFSWLLLAGAVLQVAIYAVWHESPEQILAVDIAVAFTLLVAHEALVERSIVRRRLGFGW
jgi:hypothetical protein